MFQDGIKAYGFNYTDKEELPIPNNAFETVKIGRNMRGLISDVNIYSNYFDKGSHQKKNYQTLDIVQTWGGSAAQPNFLSKKGMDMF